ncbi:MAG: cysteine desulfurase family protein [Patescibacteria group bacterium]|jgi:cysteine desulfurase
MFKKNIYLDHAATTYLDPRVEKAMRPFWSKKFGNPSSLYYLGREAKEAINTARLQVAQILGCGPEEIIFEGSGTESINHALIGTALANQARGKHIITSAIEHHAVLHACQFLESQGFEVTYLPSDHQGLVNLEMLTEAIRPETILVSIIYANNEIGTIQPIQEISKSIKLANPLVLFHMDACQAAGYLSLNVQELGVDLMSLNGSKIYGPKGTGVLYVKKGVAIMPIIHGGEQENSQRAGTENVAGIVGLACALKLVQQNKEKESARLLKLRDRLIVGLLKMPNVILNGHAINRLPGNVNITVAGVSGEKLVLELDKLGIACSTGSACTSGSVDPSHVIIALGQSYEASRGSLRLTLGHGNSEKDIDYVLRVLPKLIKNINLNIDQKKYEDK